MDDPTFFTDLFTYTHEMNRQMITLVIEHRSVASPKTLLLLAHTVNAHAIWNSRIRGTAAKHSVWEERDPVTLLPANEANFSDTLAILQDIDLTSVISYRTSTGDPFTNTVREILFHTVNHSTYHRGQLMTELKMAGVQPFPADYIF